MAALKVLVTGATGYIGGSFVDHIVKSKEPTFESIQFSVLLRSAAQVELFDSTNVSTIVLQNPDNLEELRRVARDYDIIINIAYISLPKHAKALVLGLADRNQANTNAREPVFIQASSGTSNLADKPFTDPKRGERLGLPSEFTDLRPEEVYEAERKLEAEEAYALRTTELTVIDTGVETGVKTHVVMVPTVFGAGTGLGNKQSIQIPLLIRSVLKNGFLAIAGEGDQQWDRVHVHDLVDLLTILLKSVVSGKDIPSGKNGIIFAGTIRTSWRILAQAILDVGIERGNIPADTQVKNLAFEEAAAAWGLAGAVGLAELGFTSNSRTSADVARSWGWKPKFLSMEEAIAEDWAAIV